jgi:hypothetical protein
MIIERDIELYLHCYQCAVGCTSKGDVVESLTAKNMLLNAYLKQGRSMAQINSVASELYLPRDRRLSVKLVPTSAYRECRLVSMTDPYSRILDFLDRSRYFFFQVAPQLYSRD